MSETAIVLDFADERCLEVELSGGKGASLSLMTRGGLPVPPGFVVTSSVFAEAIDGKQLLRCLKDQDLEDLPLSFHQRLMESRDSSSSVLNATDHSCLSLFLLVSGVLACPARVAGAPGRAS